MSKIYTIGHSVHTLEKFMELLKMYDIECIIDVRSIPYSKYVPQFNRENLSKTLNESDIEYRFMGEVFGAKVKDTTLYDNRGILDFNRVQLSFKFISAVNELIEEVKKGKTFCLMCSEKLPINCHRSIMIAKVFYELGINVIHILNDGSIETQDELHELMLKKCKTDDLNLAYRKLNDKIGNKINVKEVIK